MSTVPVRGRLLTNMVVHAACVVAGSVTLNVPTGVSWSVPGSMRRACIKKPFIGVPLVLDNVTAATTSYKNKNVVKTLIFMCLN